MGLCSLNGYLVVLTAEHGDQQISGLADSGKRKTNAGKIEMYDSRERTNRQFAAPTLSGRLH